MKKMSRAELTRYINKTVLAYEKLERTEHILWEYMDNFSKLLKWMCNDSKREPIIIAIRKNGADIGDKEYVLDRLQVFGQAIHTIEIHKTEVFISCNVFEVKEY